MKGITFGDLAVSSWVYGPIIFLVWVFGLSLIKKLLFKKVVKLAARTKSKLDDILLRALSFPLNLLILLSGLVILGRVLPLTSEVDKAFGLVFKVGVILAIVCFVDRFCKELIREYSSKFDFLQASRVFIQGFVRVAIIVIGLLILMDIFGVSITPLLASLGIGSLAIALALQDTLANFFAGIHILVDKPVKVGQFIRLDSGEEGYVIDVGWRTTRVRMIPNNVVVVPNSRLANSIITNYYYPEREMAVLVQVGVHYDSDLALVERVTCQVAKEVMQTVPGGVPEFEPFIRYHTFGDSSIDFTVIMRAREFLDHYRVKHEFIKRLHERYKKEGIVIPFPIRTLDIKREDLEYLKKQ